MFLNGYKKASGIMVDFFIIGAPKCGTTSLSDYLKDHDGVCFSEPKEPGYFSLDLRPDAVKYKNDADYVSKCFNCASAEHKILGEGSTTYLYSREAAQRIKLHNVKAKIIVLVRNPIDLAYSQHQQMVKMGYENVVDFSAAWNLQNARLNGRSIPFGCGIPDNLQYGYIAKIGQQLKKIFDLYERQDVLVLNFDNLKNDPNLTYKSVTNFLGLAYYEPKTILHSNSSEKPKSILLNRVMRSASIIRERIGINTGFGIGEVIRSANKAKYRRPILEDNFVEDLVEYFRDDQMKLFELSDISFEPWM